MVANNVKIAINRMTPYIGAEISGIDLSQPLAPEEFEVVNKALMDNLVIFFRDQTISREQQLNFGRLFGKLHVHPAATAAKTENGKEVRPYVFTEKEYPEILVIHADENSKRVAGENWHSDVSCDAEPPMGSILHLTEVPSLGGDTLFASMYAAYDALSEPMKQFLAKLTAIHDGEKIFRQRFNEAGKTYPRNEHPIVRTHPVTKKKALYVNREFTLEIPQLDKKESDALLQFLYSHCENERFQCRFHWQKNSIAFWDNRCAQHRAMFDYFPLRRYGHRVTVKGDRPFLSHE